MQVSGVPQGGRQDPGFPADSPTCRRPPRRVPPPPRPPVTWDVTPFQALEENQACGGPRVSAARPDRQGGAAEVTLCPACPSCSGARCRPPAGPQPNARSERSCLLRRQGHEEASLPPPRLRLGTSSSWPLNGSLESHSTRAPSRPFRRGFSDHPLIKLPGSDLTTELRGVDAASAGTKAPASHCRPTPWASRLGRTCPSHPSDPRAPEATARVSSPASSPSSPTRDGKTRACPQPCFPGEGLSRLPAPLTHL